MPKPKFVYWRAASRAQNAMLMFHTASKEYDWDSETANKWPETKSVMPFGQLPVFYDSDNNLIAQSNAITRYCAKICGLMPNMPLECAKVDMIIEQTNDIFNLMAKCKYAGDEKAVVNAWKEFNEKKMHDKLLPLNGMLQDNYYGGNTPNAGDVCVFSVINLIVKAGIKECLVTYPKLYDHYKRMIEHGTIKEYLISNVPVYFVYKDKVDTKVSSSVSN